MNTNGTSNSPRLGESRPESGRVQSVARPVGATFSLIIIIALIVVCISPTLYFEKWDFEPGQTVTRDLRAPFTVAVEDRETREQLESEARQQVPRIYVIDVERAAETTDKVDWLLDRAQEIAPEGIGLTEDGNASGEMRSVLDEFAASIEQELGITLSDDTLETIIRNRGNQQFREELRGVFHYLLLERGIELNDRSDTLMAFHEQGRLEIQPIDGVMPFNFEPTQVLDKSEAPVAGVNRYLTLRSLLRGRAEREALREITATLITGNIWSDESATAEREEQARASVDPSLYRQEYPKGYRIAMRGDILDRQAWLALRSIEEQKPYYLLMNFVGNAILVSTLLIFLLLYVRRHMGDWAFATANVNVIGLPLIITLVLGRIALGTLPISTAGYLFPAGALGMLGVILIGPRIGLLLMLQGCLLFGFMTEMNFQYTMVAVVGGATAVTALIHLRRRRDILRAGFITGVANAMAILVIRFIDNPALNVFHDWAVLDQMAWGFGNGLMCFAVTLMSLVIFEYLFRVTTDLNLIELTSIKTPLLRELEERTPGTYQHTLNVAKLAEAAAEAIGANYLLVRAGAHYHDIGKMAKPKYFTENQTTAEERRIHSKLAPPLSALIIKEHVKKGVELARLHRLPEKVIDFIPQHHGTSLIKYFFNESQRRFAMGETSDPVREEEFRYTGPKPQSVETAILMLADSTEATATSKLSSAVVKRDDVELIVRDTVREKFIDGQLDECNLTLADLNRIRESFVSSLLARYHTRIDYTPSAAASRGG